MRHYLIIIIGIFYCMPLHSQSVMTITEVTYDSEKRDVSPIIDTLKNNVIKYRYPNIDINSSLEIKLNKNSIKDQSNKWIGNPMTIPFDRMKVVSDVLEKQKELIQIIDLDSKTDFEEKVKALNDFATQMQPLIMFLSGLPADNPFKIKINDIFSKRGNVSYHEFFDALQEEIDNINSEYQKTVEANKIYFRLAAFIGNNPVHLEGFDVYKDGEYFKVPRFATSISQDEKDKFDHFKTLAEDANKDINKTIKNKLKEAVEPLLTELSDHIKNKIKAPLSKFTNGIDTITAITADIKDKVEKTKNEVAKLEANIKSFIEVVKNTDDPDYFRNILNGIRDLSQNVLEFQQNTESRISELKNGTLHSAKIAFGDFKSAYDSSKKIVTDEIAAVKAFFDSQAQLHISTTEKIQESLLKLGEEVKKIPLENIPGKTTLNLLTTVRKDGDKLHLKAVLGKPSDDETSEEETIEFIPIGLYQIGLHSSIKAVLLFVDNTSAEFAVKKQFQLNPSYSVLFKWGSRKNSSYNNFIDFGLGANMATLDFNNDNTPEIGVGIVVSAFKDYLQAGYGRNMASDDNYWFWGIRLPFIGVNLSGSPKVVAEDN
jgi:hypothetical protein